MCLTQHPKCCLDLIIIFKSSDAADARPCSPLPPSRLRFCILSTTSGNLLGIKRIKEGTITPEHYSRPRSTKLCGMSILCNTTTPFLTRTLRRQTVVRECRGRGGVPHNCLKPRQRSPGLGADGSRHWTRPSSALPVGLAES